MPVWHSYDGKFHVYSIDFCWFRCHSCSSDGHSTSSIWLNTWSSCAVPFHQMLTSIRCVATSSLILKIFKNNFFLWIGLQAWLKTNSVFHFAGNVWVFKIRVPGQITRIPYSWWNHFGLNKLCHWFTVHRDDDWFRCSPKYMAIFFKCQIYCRKLLVVQGKIYLWESNFFGAFC